MISLLIAILSSSSIAILWKIAESKKYSTFRIIQFNYLSASLLSLIFFKYQNFFFNKDIPSISLLAFLFGLIFVASFFIYATSIGVNGAILSSSVSKMGLLLPVFLSFLLFRENLLPRQVIGLILGTSSLLIYFGFSAYFESKIKIINRRYLLLLLLLFLSQGLAEMSGKLFSIFFEQSHRSVYLGLLFFISFLFTSYFIVIKRIKSTGYKDLTFGLILGVPNFFSSFFLIDAFRVLQSSLVFTLFGIGTILVVSLLSMIFFKEKITKPQFLFLFTIFITIWLMQS